MSDTSSIKPENTFSILDRIIQFRYALMAASLVLAIDVGQVPLRALGFAGFDWFALQSAIPKGTALAFAASYAFFMAALAPAIQGMVEYLLVASNGTSLLTKVLSGNAKPVSNELQYAWGRVKVTDAQTDALARKDDFWIKRVEEHLAREHGKFKDARIVGRLSFACILLAFLDWQWGTAQSSWLHAAAQWINAQVGWLSVTAVLVAWLSIGVLAFPWLFEHLGDYQLGGYEDWMQHPEMAAQLLKKIEERDRNRAMHRFSSRL